MRNLFDTVLLACLCVWHVAASAQSVDGEWRGRFECSDFLPGVQGAAVGSYGYGITVNLSSGVVDGSRATNTVEEKFTGSSDGRRMTVLVEGKRKDRPAWWTISFVGPVRDGTAKLQGQMLNRPGNPIRDCTLTLVSSEYRRVLEAESAAKQRAVARERREAELLEENSRLRAAQADAERSAREAATAAETTTRRAEQKNAEERSAAEASSNSSPPAPPKRVGRQQSPGSPRPDAGDDKTGSDSLRRAGGRTPVSDTSPRSEKSESVERAAAIKAAADRDAAEKIASDKAVTDKAAAEKAAAEKVAAEKAAADKLSAEKAAAVEKANADKAAAEKVAAERAAAERAAAEKIKKQPIRVRNSMDL